MVMIHHQYEVRSIWCMQSAWKWLVGLFARHMNNIVMDWLRQCNQPEVI